MRKTKKLVRAQWKSIWILTSWRFLFFLCYNITDFNVYKVVKYKTTYGADLTSKNEIISVSSLIWFFLVGKRLPVHPEQNNWTGVCDGKKCPKVRQLKLSFFWWKNVYLLQLVTQGETCFMWQRTVHQIFCHITISLKQCSRCGSESRSTCVWTSWIRIRIH